MSCYTPLALLHNSVLCIFTVEDLQTFRETLATLQRHVDELDVLKASHYQEIYEHEEEVWDFVQGKVRLDCFTTVCSNNLYCRFALPYDRL